MNKYIIIKLPEKLSLVDELNAMDSQPIKNCLYEVN